jgi:hypothetical protein
LYYIIGAVLGDEFGHRGWAFLKFLGAPMILKAKSSFLSVNASLN